MDLDHNLLFSYLEEDNIQRAYFRVRPLLEISGDIRQEAEKLWPNDGCLRIVPDRNEQHTFKARMRTLAPYCVVDLRGLPAEAGKIRTNKNFNPSRGETNQFILYSDTVHALPEHSFYQVIDGKAENFAEAAAQAITPLFYLRDEDTLYGPVCRKEAALPDTAKEAAGILISLSCPDGENRLMLCMADAPVIPVPIQENAAAQLTPEETAEPLLQTEAPSTPREEVSVPTEGIAAPSEVPTCVSEESAALPEPKDETVSADAPKHAASPAAPLPIGERLEILDQQDSHEEALEKLNAPVSNDANLLQVSSPPAPPAPSPTPNLTGTPLVRTPLRLADPPARNRTQEVIRTQVSVGKYEPPANSLPDHIPMRDVVNPVESALTQLRAAWADSDTHRQLAEQILALDGARVLIERTLCAGKTETILQRVLRDQLQDLEAERLTALCELDRARRDTDAYRQELLRTMSKRLTQELDEQENRKQQLIAEVAEYKREIQQLTSQQEALEARVNELQSSILPEATARWMTDLQMLTPAMGIPLRMHPVSGQNVETEGLIKRLVAAGAASGIDISRNAAIALLVLFAISPRIGVSCATPSPFTTLMYNIMSAFGWSTGYVHQVSVEQRPVCGVRPMDATPAILMTSLPNYAHISGVRKLCLSRTTSGLTRNAAYDAEPWPILMLPTLPLIPEVKGEGKPVSMASLKGLLRNRVLSDADVDAVLSPVLESALPISASVRRNISTFTAVCAELMEGGLPVAADWAILLWITPMLEKGSKYYTAVKSNLDQYPLSLAKL